MAEEADGAFSTRGTRLELAATVLLAVAAVATAWSSYQATRWNGEQATAASQTNGIRIEAARAESEALAETQVDIALFIQWVDANAGDDAELADFYASRFRGEFQPAFDAWLATDPLRNVDAPASPFALPEYRTEAEAQAAEYDRQSEISAAVVRRNIVRASNYVLAVVLFAVALFFAGISTKLVNERLRLAMLLVGWTVFLGAVTWIASFPVSFVT
jgi:hypothetical protein